MAKNVHLSDGILQDEEGNQVDSSALATVDGGDTGGGIQVVSFDFAFDTPGLADGLEVWTPAVGDVLLNAWFRVTTSFNGTTPTADIFSGDSAANGLFYNAAGAQVLNREEQDWGDGYMASGNTGDPNYQAVDLVTAAALYGQDSTYYQTAFGRFGTTTPILVAASQDGSLGGTPVGGSQGAATLYLLVATPSPA
jgi:hypothetical protein